MSIFDENIKLTPRQVLNYMRVYKMKIRWQERFMLRSEFGRSRLRRKILKVIRQRLENI